MSAIMFLCLSRDVTVPGSDNAMTDDGYPHGLTTERFFHSVARFCPGFQYNLRGPAWAVGSCSISLPAEGTFQDVIFQTLRLSGKNALYNVCMWNCVSYVRMRACVDYVRLRAMIDKVRFLYYLHMYQQF